MTADWSAKPNWDGSEESVPERTPEPVDLISRCNRSKCTCDAEIAWAVTIAGTPMPLDPEPQRDGNIVLTTGQRLKDEGLNIPPNKIIALVGIHDELIDPDPDRPRYRPHFASCPHADDHRRAS